MTNKLIPLPEEMIDQIVKDELLASYKITLDQQKQLQELKDQNEFPEWRQEDYDHNLMMLDAFVTVIRYFTTADEFTEMFDD